MEALKIFFSLNRKKPEVKQIEPEKKDPKLIRETEVIKFFEKFENTEELLIPSTFGINYGSYGIEIFKKHLENNKELQKLEIKFVIGAKWSKEIFNSISKHSNIKILDISNICLESDECIFIAELLKNNKTITDLNLSNNRIGNGSFLLADGLTQDSTLKKLKLRNNEDANIDSILHQIIKNDSLTFLDVSKSRYFDLKNINEYLSKTSNLKSLIIESCLKDNPFSKFSNFIDSLENNSSLTELDISNNILSPKSILQIFGSLKSKKNIKIFKMNHIRLTPDLIDDFGKFIQENTSLKIFSFINCFKFENDLGVDHLIDYLMYNDTLIDLNIFEINENSVLEYLLERNRVFNENLNQFHCRESWSRNEDLNFNFRN